MNKINNRGIKLGKTCLVNHKILFQNISFVRRTRAESILCSHKDSETEVLNPRIVSKPKARSLDTQEFYL